MRPPSCIPPLQLQRVIARDFILAAQLPHSKLWERDGHDNNWWATRPTWHSPARPGPASADLRGDEVC